MDQTGIEQMMRAFIFTESAIKTIAEFIEVLLQIATGNTMKCDVQKCLQVAYDDVSPWQALSGLFARPTRL